MKQDSDLRRHGLFDARVPRYTSYPTAPHFGPGVGPDLFCQWIEGLAPGSTVSVYLHVPFCRRLCWFCACRTQGTATDAPVIAYARTILDEIAILRRHLPPGTGLSRLHWGGGTPTLLPPGLIRTLADAIFATLPPRPGAEFSVEIDPCEIDAPRLDALAAAGMTRASIGVQDFDRLIQAAIGREQPYDLTARVAGAIRDRGVASLNADILHGLPHQTETGISKSVEQLLSLAPDRVALYGYAHVPWMSRRQQMIPSDAIPTPEERLALFRTARDLFVGAGYAEVGIDHFALPGDGLAQAQAQGRLRRNFQGYTDDTAPVLIGLGASSVSRFPQGYAQNAPGTADHVRAIREGRFSTSRGHVFCAEDLWRGRAIEALMCDFRVDLQQLARDFGAIPARVSGLFRAVRDRFGDMVALDDRGLSILPAGRPLTRMIARAFDAYDTPAARHAAAV